MLKVADLDIAERCCDDSARLAVEGRVEPLAETVHVERLHHVIERSPVQRLAGEDFVGVCRD